MEKKKSEEKKKTPEKKKTVTKKKQTQPSEGHRKRLRNKLIKKGGDGFDDYELLELMLTYSIPRKDVKPLAKELIARFGSLGNVLNAKPDDLEHNNCVKENTIALFKVIQNASLRILRHEVLDENVLDNWDKVQNYCFTLLGRETKEFLYVISLDARGAILGVDQLQKGTVNETSVYVREVIETIMQRGATSFLLVHNHPSGDTRASPADIRLTKEIAETAKRMNIVLHDHVIVSKKGINTFKAMSCL